MIRKIVFTTLLTILVVGFQNCSESIHSIRSYNQSSGLHIDPGPVLLSTSTLSLTKNVGDTAEFSVEAIGQRLEYSWYFNGKDAKISVNKLTVKNLTIEHSGIYRVEIKNDLRKEFVDFSLSVTQNSGNNVPKPIITSHSNLEVTVEEGSEANFSVEASGQNVKFQWFFNNYAYAFGTTNILNLKNVQKFQHGIYKVVAVNSGGTAELEFKLNIKGLPDEPPERLVYWTKVPDSSITRKLGEPFNVFGTMTGSIFEYTWEKKTNNDQWEKVPGDIALATSIGVHSAQLEHSGLYRLKVLDTYTGILYFAYTKIEILP